MEFDIELRSAEVVIGEPVGVVLRLVTGPDPVSLPIDFDASDVVTFSLMDGEGRILAQADGYDKKRRRGNTTARKPQAALPTATAEPGRTQEWSQDLLAHFDLDEPGKYLVEARFAFAPAGVETVSRRLALEVRPCRCGSLDVSQDRVCLPTTCFVIQHRDEGGARTFVRVGDSMNPGRFWEGATLDVPAGARPVASEADFATTRTFSHDFFRWVAWIDGEALHLTSVAESRALGRSLTIPLPLPSSALLGRPVQHADRSVSVIVLGAAPGGGQSVLRVDVAAGGEVSPWFLLGSLGPTESPVACAPDGQSGLFIAVAGPAGRAPLRLLERKADGTVVQREILGLARSRDERGRALRIVAVRLDLKAFRGPRAVLVAGLFEHAPADPNEDDVIELTQVHLDAPPPGRDPIIAVRVPLFRGFFDPGESVSHVDLVRARGAELHAVIATSNGRLFHVLPDGAIQSITRVTPAEAAGARLVTTPDQQVHLFLPVADRGVTSIPLVRGARL